MVPPAATTASITCSATTTTATMLTAGTSTTTTKQRTVASSGAKGNPLKNAETTTATTAFPAKSHDASGAAAAAANDPQLPKKTVVTSSLLSTDQRTTLLLALARFASAIGRLSLGPLLPLLSQSFPAAFADASNFKPQLLSAYSTGYVLTQIVGGYLADRFGFAAVTSHSAALSALILWYLSTLVGNDDTTRQQQHWLYAYLSLGLVAGPLFPAASTAISMHVRVPHQAAAAALVDAAASAGTTVASLAPLLATAWGHWRVVYQATATSLALVALLAWQHETTPKMESPPTSKTETAPIKSKSVTRDKSTDVVRIRAASSSAGTTTKTPPAHSIEGTSDDDATKSQTISAAAAVVLPTAVGTYACHCADNLTKYSLNSWAATLLVQRHGASPATVGALLATQEAVGVASKTLLGVLVKQPSTSGDSRQARRGWTSGLAFVVQGACLAVAFGAPTVRGAAAGMLGSALAVGWHSVGFRPLYLEACPAHAGAIAGTGNTIASVASILGPLLVGARVATDDADSSDDKWSKVAWFMLLFNLLGALAAFAIALTCGGGARPQRKQNDKNERSTTTQQQSATKSN